LSVNLKEDVELKSTSSGKSAANFSRAINESFRDCKGERFKRVECVPCVVWDKQAEITGKCVRRGSQLFVEGRLQTCQYGDGEGTAKTICEVVVTTLRVPDGGK
jgi:single-strand DNA-binding protein